MLVALLLIYNRVSCDFKWQENSNFSIILLSTKLDYSFAFCYEITILGRD